MTGLLCFAALLSLVFAACELVTHGRPVAAAFVWLGVAAVGFALAVAL